MFMLHLGYMFIVDDPTWSFWIPESFHFVAPLFHRASNSSTKDCTSASRLRKSGDSAKWHLWANFGSGVT